MKTDTKPVFIDPLVLEAIRKMPQTPKRNCCPTCGKNTDEPVK